MAKALCCDRCGKYYKYIGEKFPNLIPRTYDIVTDRTLDICDDCYEAFMEWWNKPTMNQLKLSKDSPYICTVTGNEYVCMGGCGYRSGLQCMDDSEDTPCQFRALPPDAEEPGADPPETVDCIKMGR